MNPSSEQNRQEALLALEQLAEQVGQKGFHYHLQRMQDLLKTLKLDGPALEEVQAQLDGLKTRHEGLLSEQSQVVKASFEAKLAAARALYAPEAGQIPQFSQAYDALEEVHHQLEFERHQLTRADRDACWTELKAARQELRNARSEAAGQVEAQAESWFAEAREAVENRRFREAKDIFQALQREVNELPLRRDQRGQWRERFNQLWEQLQAKGKEQREAAQQRNIEGVRKLEEALQRVETYIMRKEEDLKASEGRMEGAHWSEVDPLERAVERDTAALKDARRRQSELKAKIEDARNRNRRSSGKRSDAPRPDATAEAQASASAPAEALGTEALGTEAAAPESTESEAQTQGEQAQV